MPMENDGGSIATSMAESSISFREMRAQHFEEMQTCAKKNGEWYLSSLNFDTPTIDRVIMNCIEKIWDQYDVDNSGYLDREETRAFIKESIKGGDLNNGEDNQEENSMSEKQFEACFRMIDEDDGGMITKDEMLEFIKLVTDLHEVQKS